MGHIFGAFVNMRICTEFLPIAELHWPTILRFHSGPNSAAQLTILRPPVRITITRSGISIHGPWSSDVELTRFESRLQFSRVELLRAF